MRTRIALGAALLVACGNSSELPDAGQDAGPDSQAPDAFFEGGADVQARGDCASAISAYERSSCTITTSGTLWCWGVNNSGQLGDGTTTDRATPVEITALGTGVTASTLGSAHTCAIKTDGGLSCWGDNGTGELGDGTTSGPACGGACQPSPQQVTSLGTGVIAVAAAPHTCAIEPDHTLWCWGYNGSGELGNGTTSGSACNGVCELSPAQVTALGANVMAAAAGGEHMCAIKTDGTLWCWGRNNFGQIGDGTTGGQLCSDKLPQCKPSPVQVTPLGAEVASVAVGANHTCAIKTDHTLWCWGDNEYGELGDGTDVEKHSPVQVSALGTEVASVAAGADHSCAVKTDGTVWCWGANDFGQVGDGTTTGQPCPAGLATCKPSPVQVSTLGGVVAIAAGDYHTCAVATDSTLWCWGHNNFHQVGDGTTSDRPTPVQVTGFCP